MKEGFFDVKFFRFILVGLCNTAVSAVLMFGFYHLLHLGYWGSSALSFLLGSIMSFFLNKNYTFGNKGSVAKTAARFSLTVAVCYVLAYSIAKPAVTWAMAGLRFPASVVDQISMLCGMCLFTALNYVGQRFFAFREKNI